MFDQDGMLHEMYGRGDRTAFANALHAVFGVRGRRM
jgi:hypothetical protein